MLVCSQRCLRRLLAHDAWNLWFPGNAIRGECAVEAYHRPCQYPDDSPAPTCLPHDHDVECMLSYTHLLHSSRNKRCTCPASHSCTA
jgi:hypothetical protein